MGRIKLTTPEAFISAFSKYESDKIYEKEKNSEVNSSISIEKMSSQ
ncbi:MAG: hypothetical protein ACXAC8_06270 [Candidatus Hodarchaeales archaeon]|jgi:hypothetical protein